MMQDETVSRVGPGRHRVLLGVWLLASAIICVRAGQIQGVQAAEWRAVAEAQHRKGKEVVAARGSVLDRDGTPLAVSRERFSIGIAPNELTDADSARAVLVEVLGISSRKAQQLTSSERRWSVVPGLYPPSARTALHGIRGIHVTRELERYYPHGDLARGVLGAVIDDLGQGGVEEAFEQALSGHSGREVVARDNIGREIPGERVLAEPSRPGNQVVLTLDMDLQEIGREALQDAIDETEARGGDLIITDPHTGDILALVSIRDGQTASLSAINTPYEPGSTLKPFTVAGLLEFGIASLSDTVDAEDGTWTVAGRTVGERGLHAGLMTVADALRVSSNPGVAKAAQPMSRGRQYENLRDFGFGGRTGIEIPEAVGTLYRPDRWSGQSAVSLAIGYEINVTPLQITMAYGALANGGHLMQPHLVREIRGSDGAVLKRFEPRTIRRVVSAGVARSVTRVLVDVVEDGTGTSAQLGTFAVAGKSGTSRLYTPGEGYSGGHSSSFVGYFPAEDPQLVVFVKLERPAGAYYGGVVAAPVTRTTMQAALAARATHLDRAALVRNARASTPPARPTAYFASRTIDPPAPPADKALLAPAFASGGVPSLRPAAPVPDVAGLPSRIAVRRLHALGLRVSRGLAGEILGTEPAAGTYVLPGDTIRLKVRRRTGD